MKKIYALFACSLLFLVGLYANADNEISSDYENAYRWAYNYWITTLPLEQARLNEPVTRQAAAKMIVKFMVNALGKTPDFTKRCEFNDPDTVDDLRPYVQKACQLGLMWQNTTYFNPYGNLTKAQFGSILSRILWWNTYEGSNPYYAWHIRALTDVGIMKNYGTPTETIMTRWNMLVLLQKSYSYIVNSKEFAKKWAEAPKVSKAEENKETDYQYKNVNIVAKLTGDWTMDVLENYSTYFNTESEWIIRKLPQTITVWDRLYSVLIDNIDVAENSFIASSDSNEITIKIWDEGEMLKWYQNYTLSYSTYWLVNDYAWKWYTQLYWNIIPENFNTRVKNLKAEIIFPKPYPEIRGEDVLITVNWTTTTADGFKWKVDITADRVIINYSKWIPAFKWMNVVVKFNKWNYFNIDEEKQNSLIWKNIHGILETMSGAYSWLDYKALIEKIKVIYENDESHLIELIKLDEEYEKISEGLSGSLESYIDDNGIRDNENPEQVLKALDKAKELQLNVNNEYRKKLEALRNSLTGGDEKYNLDKRIWETLEYIESSDGYIEALMEILVPMYSLSIEYWTGDLPEDVKQKVMWNTFSLFSLSMAYSLKTEAYNNYLIDWAKNIYQNYLIESNKNTRTTITSKIYVEPEIQDEWEVLTHGSAIVIDTYSTINTWYDTPRSEYKADWRYKDYRDFVSVNLALAKKMKDMKLRATACPNVYSQQVADDGTYNKQKHYFWNNDRETMLLMPNVYHVYDCADYDFYAYADEDTENMQTLKSVYDSIISSDELSSTWVEIEKTQ